MVDFTESKLSEITIPPDWSAEWIELREIRWRAKLSEEWRNMYYGGSYLERWLYFVFNNPSSSGSATSPA